MFTLSLSGGTSCNKHTDLISINLGEISLTSDIIGEDESGMVRYQQKGSRLLHNHLF